MVVTALWCRIYMGWVRQRSHGKVDGVRLYMTTSRRMVPIQPPYWPQGWQAEQTYGYALKQPVDRGRPRAEDHGSQFECEAKCYTANKIQSIFGRLLGSQSYGSSHSDHQCQPWERLQARNIGCTKAADSPEKKAQDRGWSSFLQRFLRSLQHLHSIIESVLRSGAVFSLRKKWKKLDRLC